MFNFQSLFFLIIDMLSVQRFFSFCKCNFHIIISVIIFILNESLSVFRDDDDDDDV